MSPIYTTPISRILYTEDVERMWRMCQLEDERVILSICWFSGARPAEIMELKRSNVDWGLDQSGKEYFSMRIPTKKLGAEHEFLVRDRILKSPRPMGMPANRYIETIIRWSKRLLPDEYLMQRGRTTRWLCKTMHTITMRVGVPYSPYHFRHSVFTHLAKNGMGLTALMYWKGAKSVSSVSQYLHAVPQMVDMENQNRNRDG